MQMRHIMMVIVAVMGLVPAVTQAAEISVSVRGLEADQPIPARFAHCVASGVTKSTLGQNISPAVSWSKGPEGTRSYALVMVDPDVPSNLQNAGKEGTIIEEDMPRQNFYHWAVVDIPANVRSLNERKPQAGVMGVNDYPTFMGMERTDKILAEHKGYGGPCPPWNDERIHHYHFRIYALDVSTLGLNGFFTGKDVMEAIGSHILAQGEVVGTYTLKPVQGQEPSVQPPIDINF